MSGDRQTAEWRDSQANEPASKARAGQLPAPEGEGQKDISETEPAGHLRRPLVRGGC